MAEKPKKILMVEARFYEDVADGLARGATAVIEEAGYGIERLPVTGVFEIPAAIRMAVRSGEHYSGYLALGCVIRGETDHYDHICREASRALMDIAVDHSVALGFGVLTCENKNQADRRADPAGKNKGAEAARACLRMIELRRHYGLARRPA